MDFAETLQDVTARKNISENIQKELMATKNIRKNGKTYGKYDYSTNKLFNKLREVNKLNREDAEAEYTTLLEEFEAMSEEQKESLSFEDKLYKKFVTETFIFHPIFFQAFIRILFLQKCRAGYLKTVPILKAGLIITLP